MNEKLIEKLAEQASFSYGHIVAEVVAPDYSGPAQHLLVDAFNSLPQEIRDHICLSLKKSQQAFAELVVRECVSRISDVGILEDIELESDMIAGAVLEHFEILG